MNKHETALRQIAAMVKDGEELDGEPHEMTIDDAFETAGSCIDLARDALEPDSGKSGLQRFYVTMTWDGWPEGGSYGTVIDTTTHAEAERLCRQQMAESRADSALTDGMTADDVLKAYGDEWHVVDCFPLDDFIEWHTDQPPAKDENQPDIPDPDACHCGNCDWTGSQRDCNAIQDVEERICNGGGIMLAPAGECPECGALAHYDKDKAAWQAAQAAPDLLRALVAISARIDTNSGSPSWTSEEHDAIAELVARAGG